ncbi:MAG: ribbon-helix-helix domain-containing protein [Chloroflexota bacterium]|nr:ribbon-helix-helix domain-containing protein [Chloroflexota bacterium]
MSVNRRRVKVGATLDPELISAVDAYVTGNPGTDRSAVIDDALRLWHAREQERGMERQLREDASRYDAERADWKRVRLSAARRRFARPK